MNKLIGYLHFIGIMPAFGVAITESPEHPFIGLVLSVIFGWGVVLVEVIDRALY